MKNTDGLLLQKESTLFAVSIGEWKTKEDTGMEMHSTYCGKCTFQVEAMLNSEKIKSIPLAIV